ncbi:hypothetical protein [Salinarimonas soli]|uniref:STAS domain-containing protein n=1 Tax=Salinarimonas soli TaxID=1638099 RepID=A0A5B2V9U8_9HYPH|nr:hypothetical protein [Salinarimonas soli]KAA2236273.1 hypothetical protein F0L46_16350 [Salinarimonas soli]
MTVRLDGQLVRLEGACPVEDAEVLLRLLLASPEAAVDWRACESLHGAVAQVLLASGAPLQGPPASPFLRQWVEPALRAAMRRGGPFPKGEGMP